MQTPQKNALDRVVALAAKHPSRVRLAVFFVVAALIEWLSWRETLGVAGGPSVAFDDVLIHFQYARSIAEGHPFRYGGVGDAPSSGATSVLYAVLLALCYGVGFRGLALIGPALALGAAGLALAAEGFYRFAQRAWGTAAALVASLVPFVCGLHLTAAASGMETILGVALVAHVFAAALALDETRDPRDARLLAALGFLAPFLRTELTALALLASTVLALRARGRARAWALAPLVGVLSLFGLWRVLTGTFRTTGSSTKWLFYQPYASRTDVLSVFTGVVKRLADVLAGKGPTPAYIPAPVRALSLAGGVLVLARAARARRIVSLLVWLGACAFFMVPASVVLWDIHRGRYYLHALTAPLVCAVVALVAAGTALARIAERARMLAAEPMAPPRDRDEGPQGARAITRAEAWGAALGALLLGAMLDRGVDALHDTADCARQIRAQQIALAGDVARLPPGARVLMNDAGALRYLGEHETVDFVGLTTMRFAGVFPHGPGSIFEALEAMPAAERPTHAALYEGWLGNPELLGSLRATRTVDHVSILGAASASLYELELGSLGSGERPLDAPVPGRSVVDAVDVAHVASEQAHRYACERASGAGNLTRGYLVGDRLVRDGGRVVVARERFELRARPQQAATLLLRTDAYFDVRIAVYLDGALAARRDVRASRAFVDVPFELSATQVRSAMRVDVRLEEGQDYGSFHYFLLQ